MMPTWRFANFSSVFWLRRSLPKKENEWTQDLGTQRVWSREMKDWGTLLYNLWKSRVARSLCEKPQRKLSTNYKHENIIAAFVIIVKNFSWPGLLVQSEVKSRSAINSWQKRPMHLKDIGTLMKPLSCHFPLPGIGRINQAGNFLFIPDHKYQHPNPNCYKSKRFPVPPHPEQEAKTMASPETAIQLNL